MRSLPRRIGSGLAALAVAIAGTIAAVSPSSGAAVAPKGPTAATTCATVPGHPGTSLCLGPVQPTLITVITLSPHK